MPIGDTLYILILYQLRKHLRAREQIIRWYSVSLRSYANYAQELILFSFFFAGFPSHIGISGNEEADKAAKDAISLEILPYKILFNDFKPLINKFIKNVWQQSWNDPSNRNNKLFTIKPGLGEWLPRLRTNRREEIIIARLRIGYSYITHSYLLKGKEEPQCIPSKAPLTIKHVLVDCVDLAPTRQRFFDVDSLTTLLDTVKLTPYKMVCYQH